MDGDGSGLVWRLLVGSIGVGVAMAGWALVMTAILAFIGIPMFAFGLAMVESAGRK